MICLILPTTEHGLHGLLHCRFALQLVMQEVAFFDVTPVGELSNRLSEDTRAMKDAATTSISLALR